MKNILAIITLCIVNLCSAQFSVSIKTTNDFIANEAYLYKLNGSKDIIIDKTIKKNNSWIFNVKEKYEGLLKVHFPETNSSISFITENSDVNLTFDVKNGKVGTVDYLDDANKIFYGLQDQQKKKEQILPALYQIVTFYKSNSPFGKALNEEINSLNSSIQYTKEQHPFIDYYTENYKKYLSESAGAKTPTNQEIISFLNSSGYYLETSSLLRPILISFLSNSNKASIGEETDKLINTVNLETPRGQIILSELIDIFNVYGIKDLKDKYLTEAKALKCTINDRLAGTIKSNDNTSVGSLIPNIKFNSVINTKAKSLHDVKADKKILIFWASTCPHCEKEIGEMLTKYSELKSKNIEIVGFSLDSDKTAYTEKVKLLPWVNDTELKGWYSSYVDTYNIHATPTFYIVDSSNKILSTPDNFVEVLSFLGIK